MYMYTAHDERPPRKPQERPAEESSCLSTSTRGRSSGRLAHSTSRVKRVVATPPCAPTSSEMSSDSWAGDGGVEGGRWREMAGDGGRWRTMAGDGGRW